MGVAVIAIFAPWHGGCVNGFRSVVTTANDIKYAAERAESCLSCCYSSC